LNATFLAMSKRMAKDATNVGGYHPIDMTPKGTALLRMGIQILNLTAALRRVLG
jgi:hypothetical protein